MVMDKANLISILIPLYNREVFIKETLDSIIKQTYSSWECLVVDDGSTDNSCGVVEEFAKRDYRIKLLKRPNDLPKGANPCRNLAFEHAIGNYVVWFDSDDIMMPDYLASKKAYFSAGYDIIIQAMYSVDEHLNNWNKIDIFETHDLFKEYVTARLRIITGCVMFKRDFLVGKKLFLSHILKGQELELFSRLFFDLDGAKYVIENNATFLYRGHAQSTTGKNQVYRKDFKESISYIALGNLNRTILLQEESLILFMYQVCVRLLYNASLNNHYELFEFILPTLKKEFYERNKIKITILSIILWVSKNTPIRGGRWDYFFKTLKLKE